MTTRDKTNDQVAATIVQQLGGFGKLKAMIAAYSWTYDEKSVMFSFRGCRRTNKCRVTLDPSDTYTVEFFRYSPKHGTCDPVKNQNGVYCDQLSSFFRSTTGLDLTI